MPAALPSRVKPLAVTAIFLPLADRKLPAGSALALGVANVPVPLDWSSETLPESWASRPLADEPVPLACSSVGVPKVNVAAVVPS